MKRKLFILFVLLGFTFSCRKDRPVMENRPSTAANNPTNLSLDQVKQWYSNQVSTNGISTASTEKQFSIAKLAVAWDKAQSYGNHKGNYWLIHLEGKPTYRNVQFGYRKLAFLRDSTGKIQARILEIVPDALYIQSKQKATTADFSGRIFIYDAGYHLLGGTILAGGKQIGEIKPRLEATGTTAVPKLRTNMVQVVESCTWYDDNYIDSEGVVTIYSERVCDYSIYDDGAGGGGGGFDGGSGDYAGGGGGGGGDVSSAPAVSNLPGEDQPKVNPRSYMDCFSNLPDAGSTMKVTIFVQEPFPGTSFNIGPNSVGHTAISLTKTNGTTSITQTLGFYPDATGYSKLHAPSKIVDNTNFDYNVSISYNVDAVAFANLINYISNPPSTYDLSTYNCTGFVVGACAYAGIQTPDATSMVGFNGATLSPEYSLTPAGLGSSIENLKGQPNVNTTGGKMTPSKGPCN